MKISHSRPTLHAADAKAMADVIKTGHIVQDKQVALFEKKFARFQKVKYAAAVNSGTSGLHLSLLALGVGRGDNVFIPSFVCAALMNAVNYTGADVRIADINADDFNICVEDVKKKINKKTKAIIVPHMFGMAADMTALLKLKVPIIEDCAQALGAQYKGKPAGSFGTLSVYSFYATKMMTTGEGGMVTSSNRRFIERIKDLREYDNKVDYRVRYNYKMTDMQAALGISQLSRLPAWIKKRRAIAQMYNKAFRDCLFDLPVEKKQRKHVYFRYVIKVKKNRDQFLKQMESKGIHCARPVYKPAHQYLKLKGCTCTDQVMKQAVSLPIYPSLSNYSIKHLIQCVNAIV